jgi:methyl-accepting chemotaxis protein
MEVVDKHSKSISKILRKIENTIIQTTMLAVSGSIEAARAGEFGKGFAVVSADIRNLAQDSQVNLEKIIDIILELDENIKEVSNSWNMMMSSQTKEAIDISAISDKFDTLSKEIQKVSEMIDKLIQDNASNKEALEEANQGNEQIQQAAELAQSNVTESKSAADLILATIEEMGNLVEELAVMADELQQG